MQGGKGSPDIGLEILSPLLSKRETNLPCARPRRVPEGSALRSHVDIEPPISLFSGVTDKREA